MSIVLDELADKAGEEAMDRRAVESAELEGAAES
jgi:hypothetical protein